MRNVILADKQDITRAGLMYVLAGFTGIETQYADDKNHLIQCLVDNPQSIVVLDYTLFDLDSIDELFILGQRFRQAQWLLFSEELSPEFVRLSISEGGQYGVLLKDSPLSEIRVALSSTLDQRRYICQHIAEMLLAPDAERPERAKLTKTETEVLKDIALGYTTKEIASKRFSSFHTINTHRKNIFRKLGVNNAHEATKYALRSGLVDSAEYYI
jgi:DNA-binding NarL/FixJ family response regulator